MRRCGKATFFARGWLRRDERDGARPGIGYSADAGVGVEKEGLTGDEDDGEELLEPAKVTRVEGSSSMEIWEREDPDLWN